MYLYQAYYLMPSVLSVRRPTSNIILTSYIAISEPPFSIYGDGKANTPGHSVYYGSYDVIDPSTNK